ncbi:MAG: DUF4845 domain-containing protein [Gammaproteobacteria bacterium]|nr:DUF4845 domain-containing protein [Gammaproteobacteria bacterium]
MRSLQQQKGVTTIGWLIILALIGFFVLLTLRMGPSYMEYYKVSSTLESMAKESGFGSPQEIRHMAENRFDISYVHSITKKDLKIKPFGQNYLVGAKYESRVHLFGNVYVVMVFDKQVTVKRV